MAVPRFLQPYLASYDISKMSPKEDKKIIVTQILNTGDTQATRWLFRNYSLEEIKEAIRHPLRGMWFPQSLSYWKKVFNVKISSPAYKLALSIFEPRPELYKKFFLNKGNV